jgi:hypothetical protein
VFEVLRNTSQYLYSYIYRCCAIGHEHERYILVACLRDSAVPQGSLPGSHVPLLSYRDRVRGLRVSLHVAEGFPMAIDRTVSCDARKDLTELVRVA